MLFGSGSVARIVTLGLGAIATGTHIAPATASITARIIEQIAATAIIGTLTNAAMFAVGQQAGSRTHNRPQDAIQATFITTPAPAIAITCRYNLGQGKRMWQRLIQD